MNDDQDEKSAFKRTSTPSASVVSLQGSSIQGERPHTAERYQHPGQTATADNADRYSRAMTTASLVDDLVQGSHHHDETLCQLLLAARNTKLGDAAKRALRHAARKRVMELMSENDQTAVGIMDFDAPSNTDLSYLPGIESVGIHGEKKRQTAAQRARSCGGRFFRLGLVHAY